MFQSHSNCRYYSVATRDMHGKEHNLHSEDLSELESMLKLIWGHIIQEPYRPSIPLPPLPKMPQ